MVCQSLLQGRPQLHPAADFRLSCGFHASGLCWGTYIRRSGPITFKKQLTAHLIGLVIVYTVGIAYFYAVSRYLLQSTMTFGVMLWYCAVLQIVPDLVICAVAALIGERAYRIGLWIK
ncbi:biotin transporter BioY [Acidaminococcus intestini]|nr:biotin transporter BioY [Acidaminococcus intestini]